MSAITVACCQFAPTVADPDGSAERARRAMAAAAAGGTHPAIIAGAEGDCTRSAIVNWDTVMVSDRADPGSGARTPG